VRAKELRDLTKEEVNGKEKELRQELFNLRFQKATGQLGNTAIINKSKKDLARVMTVLREFEISDNTERG